MSGRFLTMTVTTIALTAACWPAAPAQAMFVGVQKVAKASGSTSAAKTVAATCPAGKRVVGAGADASPGEGRVLIDLIRPDAALTSVTVGAHEDEAGTSAAWKLTAYAVCAPAPAGLVRVKQTSAPSSAAKPVTAACPAGTKVLGTGAELGGAAGQLLLDGIRPSPDLATVTANAAEDETGTTAGWTIAAYAICANPANGVQRFSATSASDSTAPKTRFAPCPVGKVALGFGGELNGPEGQLVLDAIFAAYDVRGPGTSAWEDRTGTTADWSVTSYTICGLGAARTSAAADMRGEATHDVDVACGTGRQLTATGADINGGRGALWFDRLTPKTLTPTSATVRFGTETGTEGAVTAYGICATNPPGLNRSSASMSDETANDPYKTVYAPCREGKLALSAAIEPTGGSEPHTLLQALVPALDLSGFRNSAAESVTGFDGGWDLWGDATCVDPLPGQARVAAATASDSDDFKTVTAACLAGKHLLGVGAEVIPAIGRVVIDDLRPDAGLTRVEVAAIEDRFGWDGTWSLSAYAVCVTR
ncbi:MAG TPA: hypothetical protein VF533_13460 [Solirubrobacteraceae bacterium]|jgi:hypothetical protein